MFALHRWFAAKKNVLRQIWDIYTQSQIVKNNLQKRICMFQING